MKILKLILIFVALYTAPQISFAQQFQRLHDCDTSSDFGTNILIQSDGSYTVFSASLNYTTNRRESIWMTISADGNTTSNIKKVASATFNYYQGLSTGEAKQLQDGTYIVPISVTLPGRSSSGIVRLNAMLDTICVRFYTDTTQYFEDLSAVEELDNGDFIIGGYTKHNGIDDDSAMIIRTDNMGNPIWKRTYKKLPGTNEWPQINSLQNIGNGNILVGAMSTHLVWTGSDYYGHNTPWFMIIDGSGNIINDTVYANTVYAGGGRIYKDIYGGYFHVGAFDSLYTTDISDAINFPEYIAHLNNNFEIDWVRNFGTSDGHKYLWRVEQLQNGTFQLSGANKTDQTWTVGWAARVDHNGWTMWDNDYVCDSSWNSYLVDFDIRQDGSMVLVGAARNDTVPSWRGQELWLVSVDANGCLVPGCAPTIVKTTASAPKDDVLIYPNPTSGEVTIESKGGKVALITLDGRLLQELQIKEGKCKMELPASLAAGVYLIKYTGADSEKVLRLTYAP
jgi:hypothetical protein